MPVFLNAGAARTSAWLRRTGTIPNLLCFFTAQAGGSRSYLMDVAAVEGLLVAAGVGEVGGVVGGEVVAAGEVFFGAHIYVAVGRSGEHGFEGGAFGDADWAGGEAGIEVGVVGRGGAQVLAGDAAQGEVADGKFYGGVGLQGHTPGNAVEVEARHHWSLVGLGGFFFDD